MVRGKIIPIYFYNLASYFVFAFPILGSDSSFHNFPVNRFTAFDTALYFSSKEALPHGYPSYIPAGLRKHVSCPDERSSLVFKKLPG